MDPDLLADVEFLIIRSSREEVDDDDDEQVVNVGVYYLFVLC